MNRKNGGIAQTIKATAFRFLPDVFTVTNVYAVKWSFPNTPFPVLSIYNAYNFNNFSKCRIMAARACNRPNHILVLQPPLRSRSHPCHLSRLLLPLISHVSLTLLNPLKSQPDCVLLSKVMAMAMAALISSFPVVFPFLFHSEKPFPLPFRLRLHSRIIGISIRKWPTNAKIIATTK